MLNDVPKGWRQTKLTEVARRITSGGTPKAGKPEYYEHGTIPFSKIDDITTNRGLYLGSAKEFITPLAIQESSARIYPVGTVLCSMYGTIGAVAITTAEIAANQAIAAFMDLNGIIPEFLAYLLSFESKRLAGQAGQTTQANISLGTLKSFPVSLPPLPEQKKIAAILSSVDEAIQATQAVIEQTRRVKEGLLQELLTRGMPGHTRYKKTEVGEIPESWDVKRLDEISTSLSVGLVINPSTYFTEDGTVPMIVGSNIKDTGIDWQNVRRISVASNEALRSTQVFEGDLVTVRVGSPGLTIVVPRELDSGNCASVMIIRRSARFDSRWLCLAMNSEAGKRYFAAVQYGTAQKQFNISHAVKFKFGVPPLSEQREIAQRGETLDSAIIEAEAILSQLRVLKTGLLQDLLTGKVRVRP